MIITTDDVGRKVIAKCGNIGTIVVFDSEGEAEKAKLIVNVHFTNPEIAFWYPVTGEAGGTTCILSDYSIEFYKAEEH